MTQDPPFQYLIFSPSVRNLISFYNNYCAFFYLFLICCNKRPRALAVCASLLEREEKGFGVVLTLIYYVIVASDRDAHNASIGL